MWEENTIAGSGFLKENNQLSARTTGDKKQVLSNRQYNVVLTGTDTKYQTGQDLKQNGNRQKVKVNGSA